MNLKKKKKFIWVFFRILKEIFFFNFFPFLKQIRLNNFKEKFLNLMNFKKIQFFFDFFSDSEKK